MGKKNIELRVTFEATYIDPDEFIPPSEVNVTTDVVLTIPRLESKYVVLPKVLEGVTDSVITELAGKLASYYEKKRKEEEKRKQEALRPTLWGQRATVIANGIHEATGLDVEVTAEEAAEPAGEATSDDEGDDMWAVDAAEQLAEQEAKGEPE